MKHFYEDLPGYFTFEDFYRWVVGQIPSGARCVEVGVFSGRSAAFLGVELVNAGSGATLDLVDASFAGLGADGILRQLAPIAAVLGRARAGWSWDAAASYPDGSLDLVYLDAGHDYAEVSKDIAAWRPKVKPGGFLAGHDYTVEFPGVIRAVNETFDRLDIWRGSPFANGLYYPTWCVRP